MKFVSDRTLVPVVGVIPEAAETVPPEVEIAQEAVTAVPEVETLPTAVSIPVMEEALTAEIIPMTAELSTLGLLLLVLIVTEEVRFLRELCISATP